MRLLLGGLLLVALFTAASLWQKSWTSAARTERVAARSFGRQPGTAPGSASGDGWSRVVVGRPSGGEPYAGPVETGPTKPEPPSPAPVQTPPPPTGTEIIVQPGQVLSRICEERYGTARRDVVEAVAHLNQMSDPDDLREGQRLFLPPLEQLQPKR